MLIRDAGVTGRNLASYTTQLALPLLFCIFPYQVEDIILEYFFTGCINYGYLILMIIYMYQQEIFDYLPHHFDLGKIANILAQHITFCSMLFAPFMNTDFFGFFT